MPWRLSRKRYVSLLVLHPTFIKCRQRGKLELLCRTLQTERKQSKEEIEKLRAQVEEATTGTTDGE